MAFALEQKKIEQRSGKPLTNDDIAFLEELIKKTQLKLNHQQIL